MEKGKYEPKDRHHRKPRSRNGTDEKSNIVHVPKHYHRAWHQLFRNHSPECIAEIINSTWIDPDYYMVVRRKDESPNLGM